MGSIDNNQKTPMAFPYQKIVVFGSTSGIGRALAEQFILANIFVIAIGRRQQRLDELVQKHGKDKVATAVFDVTDLQAIPSFVSKLTSSHRDLDLVFINSGIQVGHDFTQPESVKLDVISDELTTNYIAPVHLTKAFLPFLLAKAKENQHAGIMYTTSSLALVPSYLVPNYSGSKAALHAFILSIREQLKDTGVRVLELFPPLVQSEIHGEAGASAGIPVDEYIDATWKSLTKGDEQVIMLMSQQAFANFELKRQEMFHQLVNRLNSQPHSIRH